MAEAVFTKLWEAQDALFNVLRDSLKLGKYGQVTMGAPVGDLMDDNVWLIGEVDDWNMSYQVSGLAAKDETFTFRVAVACIVTTNDYAPPRDRVQVICRAIENAVAADHTLGGVAELASITSGRVEDSLIGDGKRGVGVVLTVSVRTWLTS